MAFADKAMRVFTGLHGQLIKLTGRLGGGEVDGSVLVLTHTGAKSGNVREAPLLFINHNDGGYVIAASKAGAPTHLSWYHNLMAHPDTKVHAGRADHEVHAAVIGDAQRSILWERFTALDDRWDGYATKTDRVIPLIHLKPR